MQAAYHKHEQSDAAKSALLNSVFAVEACSELRQPVSQRQNFRGQTRRSKSRVVIPEYQ